MCEENMLFTEYDASVSVSERFSSHEYASTLVAAVPIPICCLPRASFIRLNMRAHV
jgi:hypothetical protein